jgi:Xanthine and CO dehydrogenases maturation factor, XdhC/CoxF family
MKAAELFATMAQLAEKATPFVLVTVTSVKGSTPRGVGTKMLVLEDGTTVDTIGGGPLERQVARDARARLASGKAFTQEYHLRSEGDSALGALCGGDATVFFEPYLAGTTLLIIGAGHIGQRLCSCASMLDYRVVVLDSREDMVTAERFPEADELICGDAARATELCEIGESTSVVIVTHSAGHDKEALRSVVGSPARYVGMIGSATKVRTVLAELGEEGIGPDLLGRVHAPIGLDIGAETPAELALCIMAEIIAEQNGKLTGRRPVAVMKELAAEEEPRP